MAYNKQNFQDGQILTAANLEKMENGIIAGQGAKNLLDNSNFADLVAHDGLNKSYGDTTYLADRWIGHYNITPTVRTDGIFLTTTENYAFIQQRVKLKQGKTYTLALSTTGGTTMQRIAVFNIGLTEIFAAVEGSNSVIITTFNAAYDDMAMLFYPGFVDGGGSAIFKWAALYEGAYTADTLPLYVPKGKHVEMLNCNVPLAPHNLLDNSNFSTPVNQRGATSYTGNVYTIDRWALWWDGTTNGTLTINDDGITVTQLLFQNIENANPDKEYTFAVSTSNGLHVVSGKPSESATDGVISLVTNTYVQVSVNNGGKLYWAALYEGSYDASTLPPYQPKGYAAELAACRYYYQVIPEQTSCSFATSAQSSKYFASSINFPPMRITPTVSLKTDNSGYIGVVQGVSFVSASEFDFAYKLNGTLLPATTNANYAGKVMSLYGVELSADL